MMLSRIDQEPTDLNEIHLEIPSVRDACVIEKGKLSENENDPSHRSIKLSLEIEMGQIDSKRETPSDSDLQKE